MITIKKGTMTFQFPNNEFIAVQDTPEGLYLKFRDGSELRLMVPNLPQVKAIPPMLMHAKVNNVTIDLNNPKKLVEMF